MARKASAVNFAVEAQAVIAELGREFGRGELHVACVDQRGSRALMTYILDKCVPAGGRGRWKWTGSNVPAVVKAAPAPSQMTVEPQAKTVEAPVLMVQPVVQEAKALARISRVATELADCAIPDRDPNYVAWGTFDTLYTAIASRRFLTIWISGESGNGKTTGVEQACAKARREYIEVTITSETKEADLIGDFRLIDGETRWFDGPVTVAAKRGAVLLLDELPKGEPQKIMCLQKPLMGKPFNIKKTGEVITPADGFMIVATGNSKGSGDKTNGKYLTDQVQDEAFQDRFMAHLDQGYPPEKVEQKILGRLIDDAEFAANLCAWAAASRRAHDDGQSEVQITTRRLCHAAALYNVFQDKKAVLEMVVSRFEATEREALLTVYATIDAEVSAQMIPTPDVQPQTTTF